jgi:hypothetical protein
MKALTLAIASLTLCVTSAFAQKKPAPVFDDYKVAVVGKPRTTPTGMFRFDSYKSQKEFDDTMWRIAKEGPNFAGKYALIEISCGSDCLILMAMDVRSGKSFAPDFINVARCANDSDDPNFRWVDYYPDSQLLVLSGMLLFDKPPATGPPAGKCGDFYYVFQGGKFKFLHQEIWPDE